LDDRAAIAALVHEYTERLDAGDLDGVAALFAHAAWGSPGREVPLRGAEQIRRGYDDVILYEDGTPATKHVIADLTVDVDEPAGTARASCSFTVLQARPDLPLQPILAGRYHDRFECEGGRWRFAERIILPDLIGDLSRHLRGADRA
jgi:ketosteroid isomerase-like protein